MLSVWYKKITITALDKNQMISAKTKTDVTLYFDSVPILIVKIIFTKTKIVLEVMISKDFGYFFIMFLIIKADYKNEQYIELEMSISSDSQQLKISTQNLRDLICGAMRFNLMALWSKLVTACLLNCLKISVTHLRTFHLIETYFHDMYRALCDLLKQQNHKNHKNRMVIISTCLLSIMDFYRKISRFFSLTIWHSR